MKTSQKITVSFAFLAMSVSTCFGDTKENEIISPPTHIITQEIIGCPEILALLMINTLIANNDAQGAFDYAKDNACAFLYENAQVNILDENNELDLIQITSTDFDRRYWTFNYYVKPINANPAP